VPVEDRGIDGVRPPGEDGVLIDARRVTPRAGESVLDAARHASIAIPTLCHHPALPPDGSCRMCVVEVEGWTGLHPACVLPATGGLVVHTDTPAVQAARRHVLRLLLTHYRPGVGKTPHELFELARRYHVEPLAPPPSAPPRVDDSNPFIRVDHGSCIRCWRCVRACDLLNGVAAIGVFERGGEAHIGFGADGTMQESVCEFCGMCEAVCPTDALTAKPALPVVPSSGVERVVGTLCGYCGVGCRLDLHVAADRIVGTSPDWEGPANHGLLCVKGRFGWSYVHHPERLTRPLVRRRLLGGDGDDLVATDWDTALEVVARTLVAIRERHGPDALGFLASAKCSNEENYLFQKLARQLFGTNNVDHCARLCHAPTVAALTQALGSGAMTNSMDDIIERAQSVFVIGSNTTEQHPVFGMRLRRAVKERGLRIVVADPRRIPLTDLAALHLPLRPGTDVALLNALAQVLIARGWVDREFIAARTEDFDTFAASVADATPGWAAAITGVPAADIERAAATLWHHRPGALLFAMGVTQHTCGTDNALACVNLQLLLGNLGVAGGGVNPLRGQNNVQGACDAGALPDVLPGYQRVDDPSVRARYEHAWGAAVPGRPGLTVTEMVDAVGTARMRGLWILGENAAMTDPDLGHVRRCLGAAEFLVVQEIFMSETARFAHVVLPAAASAERSGTFTNTERRVQRFDPAVAPPGEARADWWIITDVARRVSRRGRMPAATAPHGRWDYASPAEIMDELAALTPSYGGIRHSRLGPEGLQWPCPQSDHPGTPVLHVGEFVRGRGRFTAVRYRPAAELADAEYPLVLTTGRQLEHYHGGSMTRRVAGLDWLVPHAAVEVHPADAARLGLAHGQRVRVRSRRGAIVTRAHVVDGITEGTVFVPFHFVEAAANELTHAALDPVAKIPEYKVCAVALEAAEPD
jgi:formate dehydrogenase major subunit/formate dehydrogenase alpha subunit